MAFEKKTWADRAVEHPSRRLLTPVSGQTNVYDVTRAEGTVTTQGDPFNADTMNDLEDRIEEGFNSLNTFDGIDTTNLIASINRIEQITTYEATEDCWVRGFVRWGSSFDINGVEVFYASDYGHLPPIAMKKGQTLKIDSGSGYSNGSHQLWAYGIKRS